MSDIAETLRRLSEDPNAPEVASQSIDKSAIQIYANVQESATWPGTPSKVICNRGHAHVRLVNRKVKPEPRRTITFQMERAITEWTSERANSDVTGTLDGRTLTFEVEIPAGRPLERGQVRYGEKSEDNSFKVLDVGIQHFLVWIGRANKKATVEFATDLRPLHDTSYAPKPKTGERVSMDMTSPEGKFTADVILEATKLVMKDGWDALKGLFRGSKLQVSEFKGDKSAIGNKPDDTNDLRKMLSTLEVTASYDELKKLESCCKVASTYSTSINKTRENIAKASDGSLNRVELEAKLERDMLAYEQSLNEVRTQLHKVMDNTSEV